MPWSAFSGARRRGTSAPGLRIVKPGSAPGLRGPGADVTPGRPPAWSPGTATPSGKRCYPSEFQGSGPDEPVAGRRQRVGVALVAQVPRDADGSAPAPGEPGAEVGFRAQERERVRRAVDRPGRAARGELGLD